MKKLLVFLSAIVMATASAFAVDFSIGATVLGWGPTFVRGSGDFAKQYDNLKSSDGVTVRKPINMNMAFAQAFALVGQVDIIPYFGIELGVGYSVKYVLGNVQSSDIIFLETKSKIKLSQVTVPLLLKGQYEIADKVNLYLGVGPKFNFNLVPQAYFEAISFGTSASKTVTADKKEYNVFDMDLSFAIGAEFKIASAHYIGLRVGYDLYLLGTMNKYDSLKGEYVGRDKTYFDDLAISLTYRYKFGQ